MAESPPLTAGGSPDPAPRPTLPPGYLLRNLEALLGEVELRDRRLLAAGELRFLEEFAALPRAARALWIRLASRRGPAFRLERLRYQEIDDCASAAAQLVEAGFAVRGDQIALAERLAALTMSQLEALVGGHSPSGRSSGRRKAELVGELVEQPAVAGAVELAAERWISPRRTEVLDVFRLLFFGDLHRDWTEWLLRDLGVMRFAAYRIDGRTRMFRDRAGLEVALELRRLAREVDLRRGAPMLDDAPLRASLRELAPRVERCGGPRERRLLARLAAAEGRREERQGCLEEALALHSLVDEAPARERAVRVLAALGRSAEAARRCRRIATDPRDEAERVFAEAFLAGPRRRGRSRPRPWRELVLAPSQAAAGSALVLTPPAGGVEAWAAAALADRGPAWHVENRLWLALCGLALWEVVFADVPQAFAHPFQLGPLDLHQPEFRPRRERVLAARLEELAGASAGELVEMLERAWQRHLGTANALVAWDPQLPELFGIVVPRLGGERLARICDRLVGDLRRWRRGFPDLVLARHDGGLEVHEVKGPGDQLRPEQRGWLAFFSELGVTSYLTKVRARAW